MRFSSTFFFLLLTIGLMSHCHPSVYIPNTVKALSDLKEATINDSVSILITIKRWLDQKDKEIASEECRIRRQTD